MGIEDDPRGFFIRILNTISIIILWMMANVFIGIYNELAFFDNKPGWENYIYYFFLLVSFVTLLIRLKRKWKL